MSRRSRRLSLIGAALTANGLRPLPGSNPLSIPSFFGGWLTSELAPHNFAVTLGHLGLSLRRHKAWDHSDVASVGLDLFSLAGLALMIRQSMQSSEVIGEALRASLGAGADEDPAPEKKDLATPWRQVTTPWQVREPTVRRIGDIDYVGDGHKRHRLDVYLPRSPSSSPRPVVLQVHGGGWVIGEKEQQGQPLINHLASRGWICVACNYPLSPAAKWPEHLIGVKQALAWIKTNISEYGGDPSWVAVTGGSAGGHLAAMTALTPNEARYQPGFESVDTTVQACVPFYGAYDLCNELGTPAGQRRYDFFFSRTIFGTRDPAPARDATPLLHVSADAPPTFVIHGAHDSLVEVAEARELVRRLRSVSTSRVAYAELPGAQHAFDIFPSIRSAHVIRGVERFLVATRGSAPE